MNDIDICGSCYYFYVNGLSVCYKCADCRGGSEWMYFRYWEYDPECLILIDEIYKEVKEMRRKKVYLVDGHLEFEQV